MKVERIWKEFCKKLEADAFVESDFSAERMLFLRPFLCGPSRTARRNSFLHAPVVWWNGETQGSVVASCPDDHYRFDFHSDDKQWTLQFIECITLPVGSITEMPYTNFEPLPEKENWIRYEIVVSKLVHLFCKAQELLGFERALEWFQDGAGELLCAQSWVPFYKESKAFVIYSAWMENRIYGQKVSLEQFTDEMCRLRFIDHLWFKAYQVTGHIKTMLSLDAYTALFEGIWRDRAAQAGWDIAFHYMDGDTVLTFIKQDPK